MIQNSPLLPDIKGCLLTGDMQSTLEFTRSSQVTLAAFFFNAFRQV